MSILAKIKNALHGHTGSVTAVTFSPGGATVATVSQDDTIRVWDLNTEQPRFILNGHVNVGTEVVFSPDGTTLASGGDWPENTIQLWNPDTGALKDTLEGHTDRISALAFSSDGTTLASSSWDKTIRLWNTHTAELKTTFEGQRRETQSLAFSPDGKTLASGSGWEDTIIRLWDTDIAQQIGRLETYTRWVYALAFSPDIQDTSKVFLASGSGDGTIQVWHLDAARTPTDRPQMTLTAHTDGVSRFGILTEQHTSISLGSCERQLGWHAPIVEINCRRTNAAFFSSSGS